MKTFLTFLLTTAGALTAFGHGPGEHGAPDPAAAACCAADDCTKLLTAYEAVSAALANDDLAAAHAAAAQLGECASCENGQALAAQLEKFNHAGSLAEARTAFKSLSSAVIALAGQHETAGTHYVMTCPMAGADWIQTSADVANPYYGKSMLRCGAVKKTLGGGEKS